MVLAIDDSRSMAERRCGHVALEAMTLLCRAMARLEVSPRTSLMRFASCIPHASCIMQVGEVGVVSFGECGNVRALHPLGTPFTDAAGPR